MIQLTECEKIIYEVMKTDRRPMEPWQVTELTNSVNKTNWPERAVKSFLDRLVRKECAKCERKNRKRYYEVIDREISDQIMRGTQKGVPLTARI